jgi:biopolymer transport protein TolR
VDQAMQKGISVQLPVSNAAPTPDADNEGALIVSITDSGSVYFGIDPITPAALAEKVKAGLFGPGQKLYTKADARTPYADVAMVMDAMRTTGIAATTLVTAQPESSETGSRMSPKGLEVLLVSPAPSGSEPAVVRVLNSEPHSSTLQINNQQIPWTTLQSSLAQLFLNRSEKVVFVKADGLLPFADVVHVIDMCHSTGAKVVLVTPRTVAR